MRRLIFYFIFLTVIWGYSSAQLFGQNYNQSAANKPNDQNVTLEVRLANEQAMAKQKMATVEVTVTGTTISDMAAMPGIGGGAHLHYQIDNGPVIATSVKHLTFAKLTPGDHTINVTVADENHQPISETQTLKVTIP